MTVPGRHRAGHTDGPDEAELLETLRLAQRFGFVGARPIEEAVTHARQFVTGVDQVTGSVVDLGSGGGLPGLVLAFDRPDLGVTLVDRRQKRSDFLERAVARLGMSARVTVVGGDAHWFAEQMSGAFDGVTARGFGPPDETLRVAARCCAPDGLIVISEPPAGSSPLERWTSDLLDTLDLRVRSQPGIAVFTRR